MRIDNMKQRLAVARDFIDDGGNEDPREYRRCLIPVVPALDAAIRKIEKLERANEGLSAELQVLKGRKP